MFPRPQRTLANSVEFHGVGFFTGADLALRLRPAEENFGVQIQRVDLAGTEPIPARLENVIRKPRRTAISNGFATVEMIEHLMAALAGCQIDNCLVEIDGPEIPGFDGSSLEIVKGILDAGILEQSAPRELLVIQRECRIGTAEESSSIVASPIPQRLLAITFELDYGPRSPIRPQMLTVQMTPEYFVTSLAFARTFALEDEARVLRSQGIGTRISERDLLIFAADGPINNELRDRDECVRHKILDCLGDFALIGCDVHGHFRCYRSGHAQNHAIMRAVQDSHLRVDRHPQRKAG